MATAAALWLKSLKDTNNVSFLPLFFCKSRYLVLMGGGGSGKSIFAGRKILERATTEIGHRILVCRKVAKSLRDSCYRQLIGQLQQHYPTVAYTTNASDMRIKITATGSEIIFSGLDDVEKLKSIFGITMIWIEEASEISEQDFEQLDIRLRGKSRYYKQIILSFNPISVLHWLKRRFFDISDERATTHRSTYKDNRFLPEEDRATLEAFKNTDPYYYSVYCLGEWGVTGKTVFPAEKVVKRLADIRQSNIYYRTIAAHGISYCYDGRRISDCRIEDVGDDVQIYATPEDGVPYVIGVDTAGNGSDYNVAHVLDNRTGVQVATMRTQHIDEDVFAHNVAALGYIYNTALIGVECNFSTYCVRELERIQYPRLYMRESMDSFTHKLKKSFGFVTTSANRNVIISGLIAVVRENIDYINDIDTLEEMLTFVRNEAGRVEGELGAHDDCIMSLAIAHFIRPQQSYTAEVKRENKVKWTEDMWEDYWNAGEEWREMLIAKWGEPE